jgi:D-alanyl-D-alanine carboxypeptidase
MEKTLQSWGITSIVKDGSGLARRNCLSPKGMGTLLQLLAHDPNYSSVYDSISDDFLEPYLESFPLLQNVTFKTKSGTMSQVCNLAGYFTLRNGKQYTFAFFCNNHLGTRKEVIEEYLHILSRFITTLSLS